MGEYIFEEAVLHRLGILKQISEPLEQAQIEPNPPLTPERVEARGQTIWILPIPDLVRMKLTSNRLVDQVQIKDMDEVGLITPETERALSPELLKRLQDTRERE